ncbi:MAG TPA: Ig-like domain-containing protein [Gemmatimonadaceae bacterium]|nr:Ig-like domain-containing protein [Gemmatimonadaceae bacterium]
MNRLLTCGATAYALLYILSCSDATAPDSLGADDLSADAARVIGSIQVTLASSSIDSGETTQATAAVYDRRGRPLDRTITWSSSDTAVATVSQSGLVLGVSPGTAIITASRSGVSGSATLAVNRIGTQTVTPVASVTVVLAATTIAIGQSTQATATARDSAGNVLPGRTMTWSSSDSTVAIVSSSGAVTGLKSGGAQIGATSEGKTGSAALTVTSSPPPPTTNPGAVTDLNVASFDSTSAALSFTQVDDGTGQPAKYDVRYSVAPISWGSASSVASGSCRTPLGGTSIGAKMSCTVLGLAPSTKYNFQLVAFRGTMNQGAVYGSLSNVASATTTAGSSVPPPPPPPSGIWRANEPAGMTFIDERPFNTLQENAAPHSPAWDTDNTLSIVSDATAPHSPNNVIRATYTAGWPAGAEPGHAGFTHQAYSKVYICFAFKLSSNWVGNGSGTNKMMYEWTVNPNKPAFFFSAQGVGSGPLAPWARLQDIVSFPGGSGNLAPNLVPSAQIIRGRWHQIEIYLQGNTSGAANGSVDWYLDGVHVGSVGGIGFSSGAGTFYLFEFRPVWGGTNTSPAITSTQTMDWDHVYISARN